MEHEVHCLRLWVMKIVNNKVLDSNKFSSLTNAQSFVVHKNRDINSSDCSPT
jgi:hypothetical protein